MNGTSTGPKSKAVRYIGRDEMSRARPVDFHSLTYRHFNFPLRYKSPLDPVRVSGNEHVGRTGRRLNEQDLRSTIVVDEDGGTGKFGPGK